MTIKPRQFNWDKREWYENGISDGSKVEELPTAGFIAQELDEAQSFVDSEWLNLVMKNNPDKIEATTGNLLPVVIKAVQELKAENDLLKSERDEFITRISRLENVIEKFAAIEVLEDLINKLTEETALLNHND